MKIHQQIQFSSKLHKTCGTYKSICVGWKYVSISKSQNDHILSFSSGTVTYAVYKSCVDTETLETSYTSRMFIKCFLFHNRSIRRQQMLSKDDNSSTKSVLEAEGLVTRAFFMLILCGSILHVILCCFSFYVLRYWCHSFP